VLASVFSILLWFTVLSSWGKLLWVSVDGEAMGSSGNAIKLEALPKGYRFRPTDEELVTHYLRLKINGRHSEVNVIPEVDVCKWEPWDLPDAIYKAKKRETILILKKLRVLSGVGVAVASISLAHSVIKSDDPEWFFFCPRDKKYPNGHRSNRATEAGYWKATGKDRAIKSRKGHSDAHLVGMKKTLVFHRGRAPKGERTNWIMHEYRATEPDLDGTGPGQVDYVLCRLFHKADEEVHNSKCGEVDCNRSFPSTDKLSPDDVSSGLFREPAMLDTISGPHDFKKWLTDDADCMTSTNPVPVESCASDGVDHSGEETAMEVYAPVRQASMSEDAAYNQFEDKASGPVFSNNFSELGACVGSPFADDFGSEQNGLNFQDGTSEQDASLSELLEGLQNHGNCFGEASTGPISNLLTRETSNTGEVDGLKHLQAPSTNDFKFQGKTDRKIVPTQGQRPPSLLPIAPSADQSQTHYAVEEAGSSVHTARGSGYEPVETLYHNNPIRDNNTDVSDTGIKIQSREPRKKPSYTAQGTAPRRIRLWNGCRKKSVCGESSIDNEHEAQSPIRQVHKDTDRTSKFVESDTEIPNENEESVKNGNSRLAVKNPWSCGKMRSYMLAAFSVPQGPNLHPLHNRPVSYALQN
ncbi:NAC domain class transcription factor, partial [Striga asiatica]